jgi:hypothetical protein
MNRHELEARVKTAEDKILAAKAQLKELNERKQNAILKMADGERRELNRKTRELDQELENQEQIKVALLKGIKECVEKLEPEAAQIRKRMEEELWPQALAEVEVLKKLIGPLKVSIQKIAQINSQFTSLQIQHNRLLEPDGIQNQQVHLDPFWYQIIGDENYPGVPLLYAELHVDLALDSQRKPAPTPQHIGPLRLLPKQPTVKVTPSKPGPLESHLEVK